VNATTDPRAATPPCVLITPPNMTNDLPCGVSGAWTLWALAPATANADAWDVLDVIVEAVRACIDWERADFASYSLSADSPPLPAYRIQLQTEALD